MSKLLISKFILPAVLFISGISTASAALQCSAQPSCADLGYGKSDVSGCTDYIYCPFDTSYKKCVTPHSADNSCSTYALDGCPENADCDYCAIAYKIVGCDSGYTLQNNSCVCATSCTNTISLSDVPTNATPIYKKCIACDVNTLILTGWKCKTGYVQVGSTCQEAYADCESAGYLDVRKPDAYCTPKNIYLINGTTKTCYADCYCRLGEKQDGECLAEI